jgi:hypothetical protein
MFSGARRAFDRDELEALGERMAVLKKPLRRSR